jgi:hypothetical protein
MTKLMSLDSWATAWREIAARTQKYRLVRCSKSGFEAESVWPRWGIIPECAALTLPLVASLPGRKLIIGRKVLKCRPRFTVACV